MVARYTAEELATIRELFPAGGAVACHAVLPDHTLGSIAQKANRIGVRLDKPAYNAAMRARRARQKSYKYSKPRPEPCADARPRACLRCRGDFPSEGIHNRICKHCREKNAKTTVAVTLSDGFGGYVPPHRGLS
ncbi:MAG TPA: hypothetical protein ENH55_16605 [Aurantimonas coralicida]|uniref:Uncharacterized protein n=2 Tax=root TaxID=1 RepID=A0A9C9THA9_9HYPH|nr:hypothetical protein [Aurantimonas coralicida]HEU00526.1 hypothetical protein [Aurantimonas coralicida]